MGANFHNLRWTIMEACKIWLSQIGPQFSNLTTLIFWMDWAKEIPTIAHISSLPKTSLNFKGPKFPPLNRWVPQQNSSQSLMLKKFRLWVPMLLQTRAWTKWWIILRQMFLRSCSLILTSYPKCKESFLLSRVMAEIRQICSLSQILTSPKVKITSFILLQ